VAARGPGIAGKRITEVRVTIKLSGTELNSGHEEN